MSLTRQLKRTVMPFWKKMFNKRQGVYYPRAVVQGKPVETPAPNTF